MGNEKWSHKLDYVLTVIGWATGIGAIWKFPYMCARNGGGSFLIAYTFSMLTGSIPLTYLESYVGQYSQLNIFDAWQICPSLRGLALGSMLLSWIFFIYAPVFIAWSLYYLYHSFSPVLPWTLCGQPWNSENCLSDSGPTNDTLTGNLTGIFTNNEITNMSSAVPAAEEFFRNNMLQITNGLWNMGGLRWPLTCALCAVFVCIYICIVKGIRISGKIVYVTVLLPYILVTVILIRACTLPGSLDGLLYYITPKLDRLKNPKIWVEAYGLSIYFMGIGFGPIIKTASHNPIKNNCFGDSVILNVVTTSSLVYFGFSVFAVTGHLAHKRGVTIDSYSTSGYKLGFIVYPEAVSFLPIPQLWSVFLFLMLFTLGLDSMIPAVEVVVNVIGGLFPRLKERLWLLNGIVVLMSFLLAVPYTMQGGVYSMTLVEWFAFFPSLAVFGILELAVVGWIYGVASIDCTMRHIWRKGLPRMMSVMWKYICPCLFLIILGYSFYTYRPPRFEDFVYEPWANVAGWFYSMAIVSTVPVYFVWSVWKTPGGSIIEKVRASVEPRGPWLVESLQDDDTSMQEQDLFIPDI